MITLNSIETCNKKTSLLVFSNEYGKVVSVPVPKDLGDLISAHLRLLSSEPPKSVEKSQEEQSD
jgi:hypothetical protein